MKLLLYCTKAKPILRDYRGKAIYNRFVISPTDRPFTSDDTQPILNGKIVAECDFEVERIFEDNLEDARDGYLEHFYTLESYDDFDEGQKVLLKESCLQKHELSNYLGFENGYAIHIKNLHIFDKPKELSEYYSDLQRWVDIKAPTIKKAPQNMCYAFDDDLQPYILISIKPEWLCKILNGEKTIEVRKKILKEMLENE